MKQKKSLSALKRYRLEWFLVLSLLCLDLWTKNFFYNSENGILNIGAIRGLPIPSGISILVGIFVISYLLFLFQKKAFPLLSISLLLAGILGNTYDRIFFQGVRDWISLQKIVDFHQIFGFQFPFFNVADVCILVGLVLSTIGTLKQQKNNTER